MTTSPSTAERGLLAQIFWVAVKDLTLEWRSRSRVNATLFFGLLLLLMFSFAMGPVPKLLERTAPGFLWLALFMSSVMSLSESLRVESENDSLDGLRLLPVDPKAIFLGKAIVNTLFLILLSAFLMPVAIAVYDLKIEMGPLPLLGSLSLGAAAIAAPGTLYSTIAIQARARDVLLPLLMFPLLVPALLSGVKATALVITGDPMDEIASWSGLLGCFTGIYWMLCVLLYGRVLEP